ncbi:MAG: lysophospholipid acyltransferase family protein [Acidimicrobiia bacterium]
MTEPAPVDLTPPRARHRFLWRVTPPTIRGVGRTFFSLRIEREAPLPPPPFVIAANHYSHFDPPIVGASLGLPIRFLALEDLFGANRVLDWLIVGYGAIPTPRQRRPIRAVRTALAALESGQPVGVFPEATRVSHWGTLPPKRGAAWLAARARVPLVPVAVLGTGQAFGLDNRLRRAPLRVVIGRALEPEGLDVDNLTGRWAGWMTEQIARYPGSEVSGPRRTGHESTR